jgi:hypothetical protein
MCNNNQTHNIDGQDRYQITEDYLPEDIKFLQDLKRKAIERGSQQSLILPKI